MRHPSAGPLQETTRSVSKTPFAESALPQPAAVRVQRLSRDVACQIAAQEEDDVGDLFRLPESAERNLFEHLLLNVLRNRLSHFGENHSGCDGIDRDASSGEFLTQHLCDRDDSRLGRRIIHLPVKSHHTRD